MQIPGFLVTDGKLPEFLVIDDPLHPKSPPPPVPKMPKSADNPTYYNIFYDDVEEEFKDDVAEIQAAPDTAILTSAATTPPGFAGQHFDPPPPPAEINTQRAYYGTIPLRRSNLV